MTRLCLPVAEWPAVDRAAWEAAHRRGGLLDEDGRAAHWAPATSSIIARGYGRFLSFLAECSDLDPCGSPAQRITRPRVEAYVLHLRQRNHSSNVTARVLQLCEAARIMASAGDWTWLRRLRSRLRRMSSPARDDRARLVPAAAILDLSNELTRRAETATDRAGWRRALLARDALMLAVLCVCPIRAKNMAQLAIGTTLQRRGDDWWVAFGPRDMKNKRPYEAPLTGLASPIDRYIHDYRPYLTARSRAADAGDALWLSSRGKPLTAKQVGQLVNRATGELGQPLNPHLFRKIVPTELAIHDPEHVGIAQPLLGHADYQTTQQAYNLGRAIDATRRHHELLRSIRAGTAVTGRSRGMVKRQKGSRRSLPKSSKRGKP